MKTLSLLALSATFLSAAPSTDFGDEIQIPFENSPGMALIHKSTGNIRLLVPDGAGGYTSSAVLSGLEGITGGTSGFQEGGDEVIVLASPMSNRLVRLNLATAKVTPLFQEHTAPQFPANVRYDGTEPFRLILGNTLNSPKFQLDFYSDPVVDFEFEDTNSDLDSVLDLQPYYTSAADARFAAGIVKSGSMSRMFTYTNPKSSDVTIGGLVSREMKLVTNVKRKDGMWMMVGYNLGKSSIMLMSMTTPPTLDPPTEGPIPKLRTYVSADIAAVLGLPKDVKVASVAPASTDGSTTGIFVTFENHTGGAHLNILDDDSLELVQEFSDENFGKHSINGIVPMAGGGMMELTGKNAEWSDHFHRMSWGSGAWKDVEDADLAGQATAAPDQFATLFWFSKEPLVNLDAKLIKYEVRPDWTSKVSPDPIPTKIGIEQYLDPDSGLGNVSPLVPSVPSGAHFLFTNQINDSVSLSALDSTLALMLPPLSISPASGTYTQAVDVVANTDDDAFDVYYQEAGSTDGWETYLDPVRVTYPVTLLFYAQNKSSGVNGPIITREFGFNTDDFKSIDSDADGVPDFVEKAKGLNPLGGADSDQDGHTDLEELLAGTNPNDASDPDPTVSSAAPFNGEGFTLLAQAKNETGSIGSNGDPSFVGDQTDGVRIELKGMTSNRLTSAPMEILTTPASLTGDLAATLKVGNSVPLREWLVLNSPRFFDLDGLSNPEVRGGREIYRVLQCPDQIPPTIAPSLTGSSLSDDANAWLTAAQSAYSSYEQVTSLTALKPADTAVAVLAEAWIFNALARLAPADRTALGVPPVYSEFTLFGGRDGDSARTPLSPAMRDALILDGLSFNQLLPIIQVRVDNGATPNIINLTNQLYAFHVAHSRTHNVPPGDVIEMLALPLDVLRLLARGGNLPTGYAGNFSATLVNAAKLEMGEILYNSPSPYRTVATWTVRVEPSNQLGQTYDYIKVSDAHLASFYEPDGDRHNLDQGLGLAEGTRFEVTGYTDVTGATGTDGMELISLRLLFAPLASDNDTNANLLADDWETFFFGAKGKVDPFGKHPVNEYSYLQLYLSGADPRSDAPPSEPIVVLFPGQTSTVPMASGNMALEFNFPDRYAEHFDFIVQQSGTLNGFADMPDAATLIKVGENAYKIDLGPAASSGSKNFFRLYLRLKND